jgi:hypothetical protein
MVTPEEHKRRNYKIAGYVGGFILPIPGFVGAALFFANGDRDLAVSTLIASLLGAVAWVLVLTA